jgi:hypothetical protein
MEESLPVIRLTVSLTEMQAARKDWTRQRRAVGPAEWNAWNLPFASGRLWPGQLVRGSTKKPTPEVKQVRVTAASNDRVREPTLNCRSRPRINMPKAAVGIR